jgi:hypothetical protein
MEIALISNGEIGQIDSIKVLFPNVSFPVTGVNSEFLIENSAAEVIRWELFDTTTEKLTDTAPYLKDGKVYTYMKELKTSEDLATDAKLLKVNTENAIRIQRNQLLKDSDWTQVTDAPVDKTAWATYRQELRDITSQEGFPFNVVFPNPPL